jgi:NAD dependent epimerase/dehydratase
LSSIWLNKKVLVTGAGGFIASHLVDSLVSAGAFVRAFVRYNSRGDLGLLKRMPPDLFRRVEVTSGDLRDLSAVREAMEGMDIIFHLGALIAIPYSYLHPAEVVETNIMGTLNVLMSARDLNTQRVVHTSTSEVYGTALRVPIDEEHPLQGQSPYSASKIGADKLAESFFRSYGLPVVTIRPFNTYGPRQSARAVIPTIITQVLTKDEISLGSLDTRRDFTYVSDTVNGFLKGAEVAGIEGETINLGTGSEITVGELVNLVCQITGKKVKINQDAARIRPEKSEVLRLLSDNRRAKHLLGWQPEVDIQTGMANTINWIKDNLSFYRPDLYQR